MLQHPPHQRRETGALAIGRDRHGQVAAPEYRGRVKIAAPAVVLDIDQDPGGLRCPRGFRPRPDRECRRQKRAAPARSRRAAADAAAALRRPPERARGRGRGHRFRASRRRPRRAAPNGGAQLLRRPTSMTRICARSTLIGSMRPHPVIPRERLLKRRQADAVAEIAKAFAGDAIGGIEREERVEASRRFPRAPPCRRSGVLSRVPSKSPPTNSA